MSHIFNKMIDSLVTFIFSFVNYFLWNDINIDSNWLDFEIQLVFIFNNYHFQWFLFSYDRNDSAKKFITQMEFYAKVNPGSAAITDLAYMEY